MTLLRLNIAFLYGKLEYGSVHCINLMTVLDQLLELVGDT